MNLYNNLEKIDIINNFIGLKPELQFLPIEFFDCVDILARRLTQSLTTKRFAFSWLFCFSTVYGIASLVQSRICRLRRHPRKSPYPKPYKLFASQIACLFCFSSVYESELSPQPQNKKASPKSSGRLCSETGI